MVDGLLEAPLEPGEAATPLLADAADVDALLREPQVGVVGPEVQPEFGPVDGRYILDLKLDSTKEYRYTKEGKAVLEEKCLYWVLWVL